MEKNITERILSKKLIGKKFQRELNDFLEERLPRFGKPLSRKSWEKEATRVRRDVLKLIFRGHPEGLLERVPRVQWRGVLETGRGYRVRKLRYEGYPGMWVPALLYEPVPLKGKVPAVLNPNGHHRGGKAMPYKQARCINLAKRGILALNTEFIGMGELRADSEHNRQALLDLCGVAGVGVFYLLAKGGLDLLLAHPKTDSERVAVTGLSGGGWQTALLSALDERVKAIVPVAGHSPAWQRVLHPKDIGDLEQLPSDFCTLADWDVLTALFAPRPTLLIYNRFDDCCFQSKRTRRSIYLPVKPVFELLGAGDNFEFHDNTDPGTHNYESDNRSHLYRFLNKHFKLDAPTEDLPWEEEIFSEYELEVGLPVKNATLQSLARSAFLESAKERTRRKRVRPASARRRLAALIRLPSFPEYPETGKETVRKRRDMVCAHRVLKLGCWSIPATEFAPPKSTGVELILDAAGREMSCKRVELALARGRRVLAADLFGTGEANTSWQYHMLAATAGERPLGLYTGQLLALIRWACRQYHETGINLSAKGRLPNLAALVATALHPGQVASLTTDMLPDTLGRFIDWPLSYNDAAPVFCFGFLREFDIPDLLRLTSGVPVCDPHRGPLKGKGEKK